MSVLDELRNELHYYLDGIGEDYCRDSVARELFRRFDAFEAAHPGLVDLTGWNVTTAGSRHWGDTELLTAWRNQDRPACAKEANGE